MQIFVMEKESSTSGSLTDLSSLSSEEGSPPSHRKFSSTSYIMKKKCTTASKTVKQASLSSHNENEDSERGAEEKEQHIKLPQESSECQNTSSSLDTGGGRGTIPSIWVTSQDEEVQTTPTTSESPNQSNGLNQSQPNRQETIPSHSQLSQSNRSSQLNGLNRQVENGSGIGVAATHGHLFTEEEVQSLQRQIADLQVDLEQLLQYTHMLTQENNALKNILKDAVIVYNDDNMRQFCDTLLVSMHEQPLLRSGLDYDQLPPIIPPAKPTTLSSLTLQPSAQSNTSSLSLRKWQEFSSKSAPVSPISTPSLSHGPYTSNSHRLSHRALEVSLQHNKLTTFKTDPLDPETTSAKGSINPANGTGVLASQQAAESIKKLYDLTFTESEKEENQRLLEAKEKLEGEEEVDSPVKEETDTTPSGPFLSFRKSFKMSQRHRESRKHCAKSEGSPELPRVASNPPSRRKTIAGGKIEKPKFYLRDILPVLKERNQLKEQVHLLEDEVASLKSECGRLRVASNTWVNHHSWSGVLVDLPEEIQTLSASPPSDSKPRPITMRMHPAVCDKEPYFTDGVVKDYVQRGLHKVYTVEVTRSDGQRFEIYRRYGEFFTFHHTLVQLFPPEVGSFQPKNAILPSLPSIENVLMKSHLKSINKYCQTLLTRMDSTISRSVFVTNFFAPSQKDKQLPGLIKPRAKSEFEMSDYFQMSINSTTAAGPTEEEYVLLADYVTDIEGELSVSAGDVVQLINREATGWWLVNSKVKEGELEKTGLVPGDFLKRYDTLVNENHNPATNNEDSGIVSSEAILGGVADPSMLYVAVEDYETEHPQQISFSKGTQLVVIEVCEDGWWLAWADGKEGWVPASFLLPSTKLDDADEIPNHWISPSGKTTGGLKYITMTAFSAQNEADLTLAECAVVEVVCKSLTGWWKVRNGGSTGLVPASLLALTDVNSVEAELSEEEKMALSIDVSHSISGFVDPPLRSQRYLTMLRTTDQRVTS